MIDNKLVDKIAWWIPNKKLRESFRNKFYSIYNPNTIWQVEIEIFSYCNRKCWFCPNSTIDRNSNNMYLKEELYIKVLNELKKFASIGFITYSRYNEPLSDKIILKRIEQARKILPNVWLTFNTNGDYLTKEYLDELAFAGLNHIQIQCYLSQNETFDVENIIKPRMINFMRKLDLGFEESVNNERLYELKINYDKMDVRYQCRNFFEYGYNRGDTVKNIKPYNRVEPCYTPSTSIYIDYNGNVMPCCNFRSDIKKHEKFIMGNIAYNTIQEIRANKKFTNFMKSLLAVNGGGVSISLEYLQNGIIIIHTINYIKLKLHVI